MSGVGWWAISGIFLVMPTAGPLRTWYGETNQPGSGYLSGFSNDTGDRPARYYAVTAGRLQDSRRSHGRSAQRHAAFHLFPKTRSHESRSTSRVGLAAPRWAGGKGGGRSRHRGLDQVYSGRRRLGTAPARWTIRSIFNAEFDSQLKDFGSGARRCRMAKNYAMRSPNLVREACRNARKLADRIAVVFAIRHLRAPDPKILQWLVELGVKIERIVHLAGAVAPAASVRSTLDPGPRWRDRPPL